MDKINSGYSVQTDCNYYVYLRQEVGRTWQDVLYSLENTIIFVEENNNFVFSKEFAEFVKTSGNYFVLVNRSPFKMLPYSIHEIYEITTEGKRVDVRESYHQLYFTDSMLFLTFYKSLLKKSIPYKNNSTNKSYL